MERPSASSRLQPYMRSAPSFQKVMRCSRSRTMMASRALSSSDAWWRMRASSIWRCSSADARAAKICSALQTNSTCASGSRNITMIMPMGVPSLLASWRPT